MSTPPNIQGRVTIQFTITSTGQLTNIRVLKSVHPLLDAEAVRVVSLSPDWTPGMHNGRPVSVTYSFPVIFQLKDKIQHKSDENSISGF